MGIHDRDYYRDGGHGVFDTWGRQGATVWLMVITGVVFVAQYVTRDLGVPGLTEAACYDGERIAEGEVWRLLTSVFLHAGLWHLACNLLVLYWTGTRLEERYGSKEFLAFYLLAGIAANLGRFLMEVSGLVPFSLAVGASGAVTAALVLYALNYPRQRVQLYFLFPMPVWVLVVLYVVLDTAGALGIGRAGIGYVVHLCGAAFGLLYYQSGRRITDLLPEFSRARRQPRLRVVPQDASPEPEPEPVAAAVTTAPAATEPPPDEHLEARVDRILEKVSKYGQESLTPEERELLFRASEMYKKRRK